MGLTCRNADNFSSKLTGGLTWLIQVSEDAKCSGVHQTDEAWSIAKLVVRFGIFSFTLCVPQFLTFI